MKYCKNCVYPIVAVNLNLDENQICTSCNTFKKFKNLSKEFWEIKRKKFENIISEAKSKNSSYYDCVIPVSGGKDSYYQTHIICKEYNLKPLLITYHGNNYLPEGDYNRDRMKEVFNADHIVWGPSVEVLKKLNRLGFEKMGDMNWQNHCGIMTAPIQLASRFKIPLIIWGEIAWDISGMFEPDDYVEFSARVRHEHNNRGFEWYDFINDQSNNCENLLNENDLIWAKYPIDIEIIQNNIRGIYIGNFFRWDPNQHAKMMQEKYKWKESQKPFQRTYRKISNLDDKYENGVHDLLKFIKFGYGRVSDHASKDIRDGYISREQGVELVKKYDHVVPDDLYEWLKYVEKTEDYFWEKADTFRDPRVWSIVNNKWVKDNIWGSPSEYGDVRLNKSQIDSFNIRKKNIKTVI
jgi:N-acetyl sugar amidotransferase